MGSIRGVAVIGGASGQVASCSLLCLYFASTWKFKTRVGTLFLPARPEADEHRAQAQAQARGHTVPIKKRMYSVVYTFLRPLPTAHSSIRTSGQSNKRGGGQDAQKTHGKKRHVKTNV